METTSEESTILEKIKNIETVLSQTRPDPQGAVIPPKGSVARFLIYHEMGELSTIIKMLTLAFGRLREMGFPKVENAAEHFFLTAQMKVLIKTLYEWLNHIKELVDSDSTIKQLLPKAVYEQLKSHCEFRHKLITHKQGLKVYSMGALKFNEQKFKAEIMMTPMSVPEEVSKELDSLYERCVNQASGKIKADEKNFHERCMQLCRNLDALTGRERKEAVSFIERYGAVSSDAFALMCFVSELATTLIPKL